MYDNKNCDGDADYDSQKKTFILFHAAIYVQADPKRTREEAIAKVKDILAAQNEAHGKPGAHAGDGKDEEFFTEDCQLPTLPTEHNALKQVHAIAADLEKQYQDHDLD